MKFSCDRCQTRYSIGDDKVRGKVLKIRCKTCGNIIVVREQTTAGAVAVPAAAAGGTSPSQPAISAPTASQPTFSPPQPAAKQQQPAQKAASKDVEWFVAIKGKQHGPAKKDDVMRLFREGRITERTYLWNETMPAWTRMKDVPEFAALISAAPEVLKRAPPPPPPDENQQQGAEIIPLDEARRARDLHNQVSPITNDPFAAVSAQSGSAGDAPRDSTRVFIMQAGLHNRGQKHKAYAGIAALVLLLLVGVCVLDYQGYVEIPGLHSAIEIVTSPKEEKAQPFEGAAWETGEEDPKLKCKLNPNPAECERQVMARNQAKRAKRKQLGGNGVSDIKLDDAFQRGTNETAPIVSGGPGGGFAAGGGVGLSAEEIKKQLEGPRGGPSTPTARGPEITPAVSGGPELEADKVAKVIKENNGSIQQCVEQNAKSGTLPRGKQRLILTVMGNGLVARATFADAAVNASSVGECITKAARRWKFPAFLGEPTDVEAPLILSIGG